MKRFHSILSGLAGAALLASGLGGAVFAEAPADPSAAAIYLAAVTSGDEGMEASRKIELDYVAGTVTESIELKNAGSADGTARILAPQVITLPEAGSRLYTFDAPGAELSRFTSPLFTQSDFSETAVNAESLLASAERATALPDLEGVLYEFSEANADEVLMTFSGISENCHIYPYACSYTPSGNEYTVKAEEGASSCSLFLTGEAGTDFTVVPVDGIKVEETESSLSDYFEQCCTAYLESADFPEDLTADLLLTALSDYFGKSENYSSFNIQPTLAYITMQKLFMVDSCTVSLAPGESLNVTVSRPAALTPGETYIYPELTEGSLDAGQTLSVVFPESYRTLAVQNTTNKKIDSSSVLLTGYKEKTFKVVLYRGFNFAGTLKHLPIFIVIMAVFMALCLVSYFRTKKMPKAGQTEK